MLNEDHDGMTEMIMMTFHWWNIQLSNGNYWNMKILKGAVIDLDTLASDQILFWKPNEMIKKIDLRP